jgi:hypothetical protein
VERGRTLCGPRRADKHLAPDCGRSTAREKAWRNTCHAESFSHVTAWVFDLDNTLYDPSVRLFDQIEVRMTAYVMSQLGVDQMRGQPPAHPLLEKRYGTTLAGLMREHDLDPEPYLTDVHDIDFRPCRPILTCARASVRCRGAGSSIPTARPPMPNG